MHKNRGVKVPYSPLGDGGDFETYSGAFKRSKKGRKEEKN